MRKVGTIITALVVVLAWISCASTNDAAAQTAPKTVEAAPAVKIIGLTEAPATGPQAQAVRGTPSAIDGTMDPVFNDAPAIETALTTQGDDKTAHATGRLAWDDEYLYVYIEVKDPVLSDKNANEWEQDSVEIYIDEMNKKNKVYMPGIAQYRVNFKNKVTGGSGAKLDLFKSGVKAVDGGYNVTVAIPFTQGKPEAGRWIGFDLQTNDDGKGNGVRSGIKDWANTTNNNYQSAADFGNVKLLP